MWSETTQFQPPYRWMCWAMTSGFEVHSMSLTPCRPQTCSGASFALLPLQRKTDQLP